jgi:peptide/nickel transport system substrate-binding protein
MNPRLFARLRALSSTLMTETRPNPAQIRKRRNRPFTRPFLANSARNVSIGLAIFLLSACGRKTGDLSGGFPRAETFYLAGRQWGEPSSFSPLQSQPDWPVINHVVLTYETLLFYNPLNGKLEPLLAESYQVHDDSVEVTLNKRAHWNDGRPVTAWDVTYTFELGQKYKSLNIAPIWQYLTRVRAYWDDGREAPSQPVTSADPPRKVVFELNSRKKNPIVVLNALQDQRILPRHSLEKIFAQVNGSLDEFNKLKFDKDAVSSGPYKVFSYSSEKIVAIRDDNYWGNQGLYAGRVSKVKYVVHPIYKSNDHFSVALQQGRLDISGAFMPRVWLKRAKGVRTWFDQEPFFVSDAIPTLLINHKRHPTDDVHLRRAMGFAINYKDIRELAVSGYSKPLRPGLTLPSDLEEKFFSAEDAKRYGTWFDPELAKAELKAGGFTPIFAKDGELLETRDQDGQKLPTIYVKSPTGWSDWESIVRIAVKSMRAVGIDARERFVDASLFWNALYVGDFDLIMTTPEPAPSPAQPWLRFESVLTTQDFAPLGEKMYKNMGRFNDPKAAGYIARFDELLALIPTIKDEAALISAYRELNVLFMQQQPALPLVYRPHEYYQFSEKHWSNLPTAANPYLPPLQPGEQMGTKMLWAIEPVTTETH